MTEDECVDPLTSAVSDYEDAVMEKTAVKAILPDDIITLLEEE